MNRRLFLKASCGASLSLPLFAEEKKNLSTNSRLMIFCNHLGFILPNLVPESGKISDSSPYLDLFKKYHNRMTVLTNMTYKGINPGIHKTPRSLLTGTANGYDPKYYPSIDQFLAPHLQKSASFPYLLTRATSGWGMTGHYSWGLNGRPVIAEINSYELYDRLFKKYSQKEYVNKKRILDRLVYSIKKIEKSLSSEKKEQLDVYLHAVREMDTNLENKMNINIKYPYEKELKDNLNFNTMGLHNLEVQLEISVYSLLNNITNVCVSSINSSGKQALNVSKGVTIDGGYHSLSHHNNLPDRLEALGKIDMHQLTSLRNAVDKLDSLPDANGTMLDNTLVAIFAGHSNANRHDVQKRPVILIGGRMKHKGIIDCKGASTANILPTICHAMGKPVKSYANSQGDLNGELL